MKKIFSVLVCFMMAVMTLTGCSGSSSSKNYVIGVNYELSGAVATYGQANVNGIKLAVKQINAKGGINGKKIKLVVKDNKSDITEVVNVATSLSTDEGAIAILGPATSNAMKSAISVANKNKVPTISASSTQDNVTLEKDGKTVTKYGYKICYSDSYQGKALAQYAIGKNFKNAVIYGASDDTYSKGLSKSIKKAFESKGGTIVDSETYTSGDTDFSSVLTKLKDENFDVMFIPGYYNEAGLIIKQAKAMGINAAVIGGDGFDSPKLAELAGNENLTNVYYSSAYSSADTSKTVQNFISDYKAEYNNEPGQFEALGYDLGNYIAMIIKKADKNADAEAINKQLQNTKTKFSGVTGSFTMSKDHTPIKSVKIITLTNGATSDVETING